MEYNREPETYFRTLHGEPEGLKPKAAGPITDHRAALLRGRRPRLHHRTTSATNRAENLLNSTRRTRNQRVNVVVAAVQQPLAQAQHHSRQQCDEQGLGQGLASEPPQSKNSLESMWGGNHEPTSRHDADALESVWGGDQEPTSRCDTGSTAPVLSAPPLQTVVPAQ
jgi:hypothetical protein